MKMRILFLLMLAMVMLTGCTVDEVYASSVTSLLDGVVIPSVVGIVGVLVALLLKRLETRYGIQVKAENQQYIRTMAEEAVQYVAEIAAAKAKTKLGMSSEEKKQTAIEKLKTAVPSLAYKEADEAIHAALARVVGAGATGTAVK
ncbi:MAG: hypothetical protein AB7E96_12155 [Deferribacterales bacterium]